MNIAICDDDPSSLKELKEMVSRYFSEKDQLVQIDLFTECAGLLPRIHDYEILFLDIYLPEGSGMDIANALREEGSSANVIFTTSSRLHAIEAFSLNAVHYLVKPFTSQEIKSALDRCMQRMNADHAEILEVKTGTTIVPVPQKNIIYIEVQNKICSIYTEKGVYQTYASLDSIYENLNGRYFLKPQRSFIVNMGNIDTYHFDRLILSNGKEIALSRNSRQQLKQQYQNYLFDLARKGEL